MLFTIIKVGIGVAVMFIADRMQALGRDRTRTRAGAIVWRGSFAWSK